MRADSSWPHAGHRLVEQQQLRLRRQRQRQFQRALLAMRKIAGQRVAAPAEADLVEIAARLVEQRSVRSRTGCQKRKLPRQSGRP
jgi:hypothetical protein